MSSNITVWQIRASDNVTEAIYGVGRKPVGMTCDGTNIWVAVSDENYVVKIPIYGGALTIYREGIGLNPQGVAYDGEYIWVANRGSDNVTKLRASDGKWIGTYSTRGDMGDVERLAPCCVVFDGEYIWVANTGSNTVAKFRASDSEFINIYSAGPGPMGLGFDGANIWATDVDGDIVTKL
jgi:hypothetical protein